MAKSPSNNKVSDKSERVPAEPKDPTGAKRMQTLRKAKPRVEAYLPPEQYAEVEALIAGGECRNEADAVRQALHEIYLRWKKKKA